MRMPPQAFIPRIERVAEHTSVNTFVDSGIDSKRERHVADGRPVEVVKGNVGTHWEGPADPAPATRTEFGRATIGAIRVDHLAGLVCLERDRELLGCLAWQ